MPDWLVPLLVTVGISAVIEVLREVARPKEKSAEQRIAEHRHAIADAIELRSDEASNK